MELRELLVTCPDGRVLEVATLGDPSGHTVVFHHGSPGSSLLLKAFEPLLERENFFFVTSSRAGYGRSTRVEGRNIASVVGDVTTALDYLERDTYAVVGWSGGGPHALACAAMDVPRCLSAVSIAGVVDVFVDFDWTAGMGPENVEEFELAKEGGPAYEAHIAEVGERFAGANADNIIELFGGLLSDADKEVLANEKTRDEQAKAIAHGLSNGWRGFYDDDRAFLTPWGFDPTTISVPVAIWYGDQDLMVPPTHGEWMASHLPTATSLHLPNEGHISIFVRHVDELASTLAKAFE